jgi:hypothetical protein
MNCPIRRTQDGYACDRCKVRWDRDDTQPPCVATRSADESLHERLPYASGLPLHFNVDNQRSCCILSPTNRCNMTFDRILRLLLDAGLSWREANTIARELGTHQ